MRCFLLDVSGFLRQVLGGSGMSQVTVQAQQQMAFQAEGPVPHPWLCPSSGLIWVLFYL